MDEIRTAPELEALRKRLEDYWAARNREIEWFRRLRFMEIQPKVPVAYDSTVIITPKAHQIIERMTGTLTTNPIEITVPPAANTTKAQEQSSKMEKWTKLALEQLQKQAGQDNIERFVEHLLADAHACWRLLYTRDYWPKYPRRKTGKNAETGAEYDKRTEEWKKGKPLPISWSTVDPLQVFPMFSEMGMVCVLESDKRDVAMLNPAKWQLKKKSPELWELMRQKAQAQGQVEFIQIWYRDVRIYAVDGEIVHRQRHRYGAPPYIYATGIGTTSRESGTMAVSVLFPLRHILPAFDTVLSQKLTACALYGWPTPIWTVAKDRPRTYDAAGNPTESRMEIVMGETVTKYPDEEIGFLEWKGSVPDIDELIVILDSMVKEAGLASVLHGVDQAGQSGYRLNQLISAARSKFKPITNHTERALEQLIRALWDIVEFQIKEPVYLYSKGKGNSGWIGLGPEDLNGYRQVEVKLSPMMPTDAYAKSSMTINQVKTGLLDVRTALEDLGREQPEEIMDALLADEWKRDARVKAVLIEEALKRMKIKVQKDRDMAIGELIQLMPSLPPAFQQALMMVMQGQGQGQGRQQGGGGNVGAGGGAGLRPPPVGVTAAPGVAAVPQAPGPGGMVGRQVRPAGIASGRAPGVRRRGVEG